MIKCFTPGVQKWTDGSMYCGTFKDDLKHGVGLYHWPNGEVLITLFTIMMMFVLVYHVLLMLSYVSESVSLLDRLSLIVAYRS